MPDPRDTPAMQQFSRFKQRHIDCMLLFRMGDFYETFDDDAIKLSKLLGLTLTQRQGGIPMAGVPHHQLETYLKRLIALGVRVAVCDQLIDASQAKGLVPRAVTRVVTPGTLVDEALLDGDAASSVAALAPLQDDKHEVDAGRFALAVCDASTGDFVVLSVPSAALVDELARRGVREVLFAEQATRTSGTTSPDPIARAAAALAIAATPRPAWQFRPQESRDALTKHFQVRTLAPYGLEATGADTETPALVAAAGGLLRYLQETQTLSEQDRVGIPDGLLTRGSLAHLRPPRRETGCGTLIIDAISLRSLEVERTLRGEGQQGSLLGVFAHAGTGKGSCRTPMGRRLMREWLVAPSSVEKEIASRHAAVGALLSDARQGEKLGDLLSGVQDAARIGGRVALARATPRDLVALARSIARTDGLLDALGNTPALADVRSMIERAGRDTRSIAADTLRLCVDDPPAHLREGGLFRDGVDAELDEARMLQRDAGAWLSAYQTRLITQHNLPNLKVGYNKVAGYFIELPEAQARSAPPELRRMQTLRNAERYTTPELSEFERKVTTAESRAQEREKRLFLDLCARWSQVLNAVQQFSSAVARLDVLLAFADKARHKGWIRPEVVERSVLVIRQGRHPVLEDTLAGGCVPNDCELGARGGPALEHARDEDDDVREPVSGSATLALITGPNMAGKSTYIRQVALITLLAHAGSFVPARSATIGLTDRIFTRIGADDALHAGQSTFMIEMIETANILHHATPRSLVVLDEVGRGTSTLDGLSLAWAIVEHLAGSAKDASAPARAGPRTLFATHYHELTDLEERLPGRVTNLHVAVREWPAGGQGRDAAARDASHSEIVFLHRILPGRTDQSFGLHVARLAGIPHDVIARAREVLSSLAVHHTGEMATTQKDPTKSGKRRADTSRIAQPAAGDQLALFKEYLPHPALDALREVKLDTMTPMQAFDALRRLHELANDDTDSALRST